jgi:hypothetical protein
MPLSPPLRLLQSKNLDFIFFALRQFLFDDSISAVANEIACGNSNVDHRITRRRTETGWERIVRDRTVPSRDGCSDSVGNSKYRIAHHPALADRLDRPARELPSPACALLQRRGEPLSACSRRASAHLFRKAGCPWAWAPVFDFENDRRNIRIVLDHRRVQFRLKFMHPCGQLPRRSQ